MNNPKRTIRARFGVALGAAALVALTLTGCTPKPAEEASQTPPAGADGTTPANGSAVTSGPGAPVIQPGMAGVPKK
jgi:hypothetical protein